MIAELRALLLLERDAARAAWEAARAGGSRADPGQALAGLVVADTSSAALGRAASTLRARDGGDLPPGFSAGDPVLLSRRRAPDETIPALVARRTRRALTLVFEEPPPPELEEGELVLERAWDETTHERLMAGLAELEAARTGRNLAWRRLLQGEEAPRPALTGEPADDPRLNGPQREAVARAGAAEDLFLVHGPPGTGKTEVLAAVAARELARGGTVLGVAASNAAVDNLVARLTAWGLDPVRLGHPARVHPLQVERTLEARVERHEKARIAVSLTRDAQDLLRRADRAARQGRAADRFAEARQCRAEARRLLAEARTLARAAEDEVLRSAPVVCATLTGLGHRLRGRRFSLAVIDEATQAVAPATFLALLSCERAVLAGDPMQLPPTVLSPEAGRRGLSRSLFERLLERHGEGLVRMLEIQHRMHAEIGRFPSNALYSGRLVPHLAVAAHRLAELPGVASSPLTREPFTFLDSAGKGWTEESPEGGESRRNPGEAERVVREVHALRASGVAAADIGVIAPYAAQVQLLRQLLPEEELEIDTVDAFQGREKEAICVSLTRSNETGEIGFLADVRRMNVALTRARRRLFVVGDSATIGAHPFYASFVADAQARGLYRSAWEEEPE